MKRVAHYVRVSTDEQQKHGLSVDNQIEALAEYSKNEGHVVVGLYNDAGISARKSYSKRPALLKLIEDCKAHKIDLILFTRLDRWFRSVADYYEVQSILDSCKVPWKAIWEDYETITSAGVFKVNIMLSVAQSEADKTSERIRNTFDYKREKGEYCGGNKAPIGYTRDGKKIDINPEEQAGVIAFFNAYISTGSIVAGIRAAAEHGLELNNRKADRLLIHPAYYGGVNYVVTPYITKEQHELIEKIRNTRRKVYANNYKYIFSGLLRCGICGGSMVGCRTVHHNKNGTEHHSIRYVCRAHENGYNCTGSSIAEKDLEAFILARLDDDLKKYTIDIKAAEKGQKQADKLISKNKARLKRLRDLYEIGDINFAEYKEKRTVLLQEIEELQKEFTHKASELPNNWIDMYCQLDAEHKRAFLAGVFDHVEINGMRCKEPTIFF